jgi:hypothetical protein
VYGRNHSVSPGWNRWCQVSSYRVEGDGHGKRK